MSHQFRNLVFEGGGVKGLGYVGALEVLGRKGILEGIERVGGASAGAITAVLVGIGTPVADIGKSLMALDFSNFLDDSFGVVRDTKRLLTEFGWYKGDFFREWMGDLIAKRTGSRDTTFAELHEAKAGYPNIRDITLVGTNLSTRYSELFSFEHTPSVRIADAARASMSIPLFFAAAHHPETGDLFVDGGVLRNYPIKLFDREHYIERFSRETRYYDCANAREAVLRSPTRERFGRCVYNKETLGFRLDSAAEISVFQDGQAPIRHEIDDFFSYSKALISTILDAQNSSHLHSDDWHRTIYIDTLGVEFTDFDIQPKKKRALIESGRRCTERYLAWFQADDSRPKNR